MDGEDPGGGEVPTPLDQRVSGRFRSQAMARDALRSEALKYGREQAEQRLAAA